MRKLLMVLFVLAVVLGNTSLQAQSLSIASSKDIEREIPLDPSGPIEGGPITRGTVIQAASAYLNGNVITVVFNKEMPSAHVSITNITTGEKVYSETHFSPELITVNLSSEETGEFILEIESANICLSGNFDF